MQNPPPFPACRRHITCDTWLPCRHARQNSPNKPRNAEIGVFSARWANFFALTHTIGPRRANFFARRTQPHGNCETTITTATAAADQRETTITSAPEKRAQNSFFSSAKAMPVSGEARPARAKAIAVSTPHGHDRAKATAVSSKRSATPARSYKPAPQKTRT